jgi:hypothetical protein
MQHGDVAEVGHARNSLQEPEALDRPGVGGEGSATAGTTADVAVSLCACGWGVGVLGRNAHTVCPHSQSMHKLLLQSNTQSVNGCYTNPPKAKMI